MNMRDGYDDIMKSLPPNGLDNKLNQSKTLD